MHQPVLDGDMQQMAERSLTVFRQRRGFKRTVQSLADVIPILVHFPGARPIPRLVRRQTASHRVNAEREQAV